MNQCCIHVYYDVVNYDCLQNIVNVYRLLGPQQQMDTKKQKRGWSQPRIQHTPGTRRRCTPPAGSGTGGGTHIHTGFCRGWRDDEPVAHHTKRAPKENHQFLRRIPVNAAKRTDRKKKVRGVHTERKHLQQGSRFKSAAFWRTVAQRPLDLQPDGPHRDTRLSPTEHERQEVNRAIHSTADRQCYGLHELRQQMAILARRISSRITTEAIFIGGKVVRLQ